MKFQYIFAFWLMSKNVLVQSKTFGPVRKYFNVQSSLSFQKFWFFQKNWLFQKILTDPKPFCTIDLSEIISRFRPLSLMLGILWYQFPADTIWPLLTWSDEFRLFLTFLVWSRDFRIISRDSHHHIFATPIDAFWRNELGTHYAPAIRWMNHFHSEIQKKRAQYFCSIFGTQPPLIGICTL